MAIDPYQAARTGDLEGLRAFAEGQGDLNIHPWEELERTPLHVAIESNRVDAARLLIDLGADIHAEDYRANRPLHNAAGMGFLTLVELLLARGAEPDAVNVFGDTALHRLAAGGGRSPEDDQVRIVHHLVAAGGTADAIGNAGRTPQWYAASRGEGAVAAALLEAGADPTRRAKGKLGSPVEVASEEAAELLQRG